MQKKSIIIILLIMIFVLTACQNTAEDMDKQVGDSLKLIDMNGKPIELGNLPKRIVSLSPSNTEIVFALGAGSKLVGVTSFCDYPNEALSIEKIGDFEGPNIEMIKKVQPDVILAGVYIQEDIVIALENLGIPVITTEASDFKGIYDSITLIGKLVDREDKAEEIINDMKKTIDDIKSKTKDLNMPNVFYVAWFEPLITAGQGTFINDVIEISGAKNIAEGVEGWTEYSAEELIKQNPDMVIAALHANNEGISKEDLLDSSILKNLECVKSGNIYIMKDDNLISRPAPRIVEAVKEMTNAIHKDIF